MKFRDLLSEDKQTELEVHKQVEIVKEELDEVDAKSVLLCAMEGPVIICCQSCPCLSALKLQMLRAEVALVEREIGWLERQINELKLDVYQEKDQTKQRDSRQLKEDTVPQRMIQHKDHDILSQLPESETLQNSKKKDGILCGSSDKNW